MGKPYRRGGGYHCRYIRHKGTYKEFKTLTDMQLNITFILAGFAGFVFYSLAKLNSLSKDAQVANIPFDWYKDYVKKDIFGILASFMSIFVWQLMFSEIATKYPAIEGFAITSFVVMGAIGSWALQLLLGRAKKAIRKVVDEKTDELDKMKGDTE